MAKGRFNSIGARLTLLGALVTFVICTALCTTLYFGVSVTLHHGIDAFLVGEVYEFLSAANLHEGDDGSLEREVRRELSARTLADLAFRLFDAAGRLILTSDPGDAIARHWTPSAALARDKTPVFESIDIPDTQKRFRLCSLRVRLDDGRDCIAQASYSLERIVSSLAQFRRICYMALALSVLAALGAGRWLALRSLRPLRTITAAANQIDADELDRRLPLSGTGDELDQLTGTLNGMLLRIERYVSQLRQFTADASHELRTPLAALRGATEVALARERTADGLRSVLEEHIEHFERLQRIAEDLLLLSRLDAGEEILSTEVVDLHPLIDAAVDLYRPVAEEASIQVSTSSNGPVRVIGDDGRIRQVFCNLLDNALKYTGKHGAVNVSLSTSNGHAVVSIQDNGSGISKAELAHVFDRFYRADGARSSIHGRGSGLGLSICRSIIQAHGGTISIESRESVGTTVRIALELAPQRSS